MEAFAAFLHLPPGDRIFYQENEMRNRIGLKINSQRGVLLIEILTSLGVLLPILLIALFVLINAHQLSQESRERLLALTTAHSVLETIKDTALPNVLRINTAGLIPAALPQGAVVITSNPANPAGATLATLTVTVSWQGTRNTPRNLRVTTMRSRY